LQRQSRIVHWEVLVLSSNGTSKGGFLKCNLGDITKDAVIDRLRFLFGSTLVALGSS
jgi:hypothetical protein